MPSLFIEKDQSWGQKWRGQCDQISDMIFVFWKKSICVVQNTVMPKFEPNKECRRILNFIKSTIILI